MGLITTLIKVGIGSAIAKDAINTVSDKISNTDFSAIQNKFQRIKCYKCGKIISADSLYCPQCGASFGIDTQDFKYVDDNEDDYDDIEVYSEYADTEDDEDSRIEEPLSIKCPMCGAVEEYGAEECSYCGYIFHYE